MSGTKIEYTLRESHRAKRVILRVGVKGLEVVVPRRFGRRQLPDIIEDHRDWIEKELQRIQESPANSSVKREAAGKQCSCFIRFNLNIFR